MTEAVQAYLNQVMLVEAFRTSPGGKGDVAALDARACELFDALTPEERDAAVAALAARWEVLPEMLRPEPGTETTEATP